MNESHKVSIMDTNTKGDISLACVIAELTKKGISVFIPMTDNKRYDLVMDYNGDLYRMQVKTINYKPENGLLIFKTVSSNTTKTKGYYDRSYTPGEIEGFLAYCIELDKVYLAWIDEVPVHKFYMRCQETKNNQKKGVRFSHEFELEKRLAELDERCKSVRKKGETLKETFGEYHFMKNFTSNKARLNLI